MKTLWESLLDNDKELRSNFKNDREVTIAMFTNYFVEYFKKDIDFRSLIFDEHKYDFCYFSSGRLITDLENKIDTDKLDLDLDKVYNRSVVLDFVNLCTIKFVKYLNRKITAKVPFKASNVSKTVSCMIKVGNVKPVYVSFGVVCLSENKYQIMLDFGEPKDNQLFVNTIKELTK